MRKLLQQPEITIKGQEGEVRIEADIRKTTMTETEIGIFKMTLSNTIHNPTVGGMVIEEVNEVLENIRIEIDVLTKMIIIIKTGKTKDKSPNNQVSKLKVF
jgi:hypothetical protein